MFYSSFSAAMDMRFGRDCVGTPEMSLDERLPAAARPPLQPAALLDGQVVNGSKTVDAQAGAEPSPDSPGSVGRTDLIYGPGMLELGDTLDYAMMVVDGGSRA